MKNPYQWRIFEAVSFSGKHQAGLQAVIKGDVDIVPISDQIMASEFKNGNADENAVKVVHSSAAIPAEAMVVSKTVNEDLKKTLTKFLVEYNNKDYFDKVIKKPMPVLWNAAWKITSRL